MRFFVSKKCCTITAIINISHLIFMRKLSLLIVPILLLLPFCGHAAVTEAGEAYVLGSQETVEDNLYAAGGTVQISGNVEQDATVAGGNVTVTGSIGQDLLAAGGTVLVLGDIGEDARLAGGNVTVIGDVGQEVMAAGGVVTISPDTVVADDAFISGGSVVIDGVIEGDVEVYGKDVQISGKITGSVTGKMTKLTIADGAEIGGNLAYKSPQEAIIGAASAIAGSIDYEQVKISKVAPPNVEGSVRQVQQMFAQVVAALAVIKYLSTLIAGLVLILLFAKKSHLLVNETLGDFGSNILVGLGVMLAGPIALVALFITGVGSVLAVLGITVLAVVATVGGIYSGIVLGGWIRKIWSKSESVSSDWKSVLLGITLMSLIAVIPIFGWLFKFVFVLAVVGTACRLKYYGMKN